MNREQFLDALFTMFPRSFTDGNKQIWWDAYKKALSDVIDYDDLYETLVSHYDGKTAPTPAWLKKNAKVKQELADMELKVHNLYATAPNGIEYMFGYTEDQTYALACEDLFKRGFKHFRKAE